MYAECSFCETKPEIVRCHKCGLTGIEIYQLRTKSGQIAGLDELLYNAVISQH